MIREGSVVRIRAVAGTKVGRPGVVLRVFAREGRDYTFVAFGTGRLRADRPHVAVLSGEPAAVALGLTKPTYFYQDNAWIGSPRELEERAQPCPPYLVAALGALFGFKAG